MIKDKSDVFDMARNAVESGVLVWFDKLAEKPHWEFLGVME